LAIAPMTGQVTGSPEPSDGWSVRCMFVGLTAKKQEAAAFLANVNHETGGLVYIDETNTANWPHYCDTSQPYGCPAGQSAYHGRGPIQFDVPFGHSLISKYAMATRRHMIEYGTTVEQLAEIAVSTRYNAGFNPEAFYRDPITIDDKVTSDNVIELLRKMISAE